MISLRYGKLFKIPRKIAKYTLSAFYPLVIHIWPLPKVMSIEETIDKIVATKASIVRFGDSEVLYIVDKLNLPYQAYDNRLADRFREILKSNDDRILVGLPLGYRTLDDFQEHIKIFWRSQISWTYPRFRQFLNLNKTYYNANITRLYYGFKNKEVTVKYFALIRRIWENRPILLIEGEKSRLGVGNDLFSNATGVKRILGPAHHAYSKYSELYNEAVKHDRDNLVLIAMGPTAKPLAYDLAKAGYQAIDIGNIDLEYEWFRLGTEQRVRIKGKYTSEVKGGRIVEDIIDPQYERQIVSAIL